MKINNKGIIILVIVTALIILGFYTMDNNQLIKNIDVEETQSLIEENKNNAEFIIIDVRTSEEYSTDHLEEAMNIDYRLDNFRDEINKLSKNKKYLIYCERGKRGESALSIMEELDFKEVYHMKGGLSAWKASGFQVVTGDEN